MKPVTLFYQPRCPFCKKALGYLEELQRQEPYSRIEIRMIDELAERAGVGDEVRAITASAMRGEIDFRESFSRRVALLKPLLCR